MENAIQTLQDNFNALPVRDRDFASSLLSQFDRKGHLSVKQSEWVEILAERAVNPQPAPAKAEVGSFAGVIALFKQAQKSLKWPKIRLALADGSPIALAHAGPKSKYSGSILVTDGKPFGQNKWYGHVTPDGQWDQAKKAEPVADELAALLKKLAVQPARTAAEHGRLTGVCCFCNSALKDEKSTAVGYGPTCAKHFSMPWGKGAGQNVLAF